VKGAEAGFEVFVATPDKDAAQLVSGNIRLYRPGKSGDEPEIYDEKGVCEKWKLSSPKQMIDYLALAGDASDNIPGIRGVGEKTAIELLSQFGDVETIVQSADSLKGKLAEKVANGAEDAKISKFLTTIRTDVPMDVDFEEFKIANPDTAKLAAFCKKYEMNRLAKEFGVELDEAPSENADVITIESFPHDYRLVDTEEGARELAKTLASYQRIAFDTETAPSDDGHDAMEAHYCKLVGFSFAVEPGKAWYVTGDFIDIFRPIFADPSKILVSHNVKFDRSVLLRYGIGFASVPRDTMLEHYCLDSSSRHSIDVLSEQYLKYRPIPIERLIGEKERGKNQLSMSALKPAEICDYAAEDADVALRLDDILRPLVEKNGAMKALDTSEEPLVKILMEMEREGVRIDVAALKEYGRELDAEITDLLFKIHAFAKPGFNPDSPKQLSTMLFEDLKLPVAGVKKTTSGQYSTDEKTLSKLIHAHEVIPLILEYRACAKLKSTYVDKLPQLIDQDSRVHTTYAQAFTETGRLSSLNPNLQNIPIRTERGKLIRKAFVARDESHLLLSADYSQIELRLMAAFSQDEAMIDAFKRGEDIHRDTASRIFSVLPALVTPEQRSQCKMVNFGIIYGISAFGLSQRLKISRKEASDLIETYFKTYPRIKSFMTTAIEKAREKGYAETILGRRRYLKDISSRNATARQAAERDAINTPIQGSAADLVKVAMVRIDSEIKRRGLRAKMVLQIHDELVFDVPREEVEELKVMVSNEMSNAIDFGVPIEVGIGIGENWLVAH
jgi:DNA polymerase-1